MGLIAKAAYHCAALITANRILIPHGLAAAVFCQKYKNPPVFYQRVF